MNILFINGLHPKLNNKMGGIFITQKLRYLKGKGINFFSLSPVVVENHFYSFIKSMFKIKKSSYYPPYMDIDDIRFNFINVKAGILSRIKLDYLKKVAKKIEKEIDINKFDLIHAHSAFPYAYVAHILGKKYRKPYVVTSHGSDITIHINKSDVEKEKILTTLNNAAKCVFVSDSLLKTAKRFGYKGDNSVVIPNGIDVNNFRIMNREKIKKDLGLKKYVVGFVGNLIEIKGADRLSKIFNIVYQNNRDVSFIVIGDGVLKDKIKNETKNIDVRFEGIVSHNKINYYMNAMDIMILPSRNEGFGIVLIEAMACGTYVIGSDVGGIPEVIKSYGSIVKNDENMENRFANEILKIISEGYYRENIRRYALNYDWNVTMKREVEIYKNILYD